MSAPLLSRFDLVFILLDKPDETMDQRLSEHILAVRYLPLNILWWWCSCFLFSSSKFWIQSYPLYVNSFVWTASRRLSQTTTCSQTSLYVFYPLSSFPMYWTGHKCTRCPLSSISLLTLNPDTFDFTSHDFFAVAVRVIGSVQGLRGNDVSLKSRLKLDPITDRDFAPLPAPLLRKYIAYAKNYVSPRYFQRDLALFQAFFLSL